MLEVSEPVVRAEIVKPPLKVATCASGFVTTTFQVPVAAPVIGQLPVERVVELVKVNPVQEMSDWASLVNFTVAPETKLVPETEVMEAEVLLIPVVGLMAETVGAGKLIVNPFTKIWFCLPGLVTTTFQVPGAPPG